MLSVGIFCGSAAGNHPAYLEAARRTGKQLAEAGITLIYGGGKVGLMGEVANAALACGGSVHGVIPRALVDREIAHRGLTQLHIVENMHQRKHKMAELSDAFIALPGGAGTFEEIFEQWTWAQLGIHQKPCAFLNVNGYYNPLRQMTQQMATEGFIQQRYINMLPFSEDLPTLIAFFKNYTAPLNKWAASGDKPQP